jgi:glycerol kinase
MGAAYLAGLAVGYWKSADEIQDIWQEDVQFNPTNDREAIEAGIKRWYRAINALEYWTENA